MTALTVERPTWHDWVPPESWKCPRCGWRIVTSEAAPRCPRCVYQESLE